MSKTVKFLIAIIVTAPIALAIAAIIVANV